MVLRNLTDIFDGGMSDDVGSEKRQTVFEIKEDESFRMLGRRRQIYTLEIGEGPQCCEE